MIKGLYNGFLVIMCIDFTDKRTSYRISIWNKTWTLVIQPVRYNLAVKYLNDFDLTLLKHFKFQEASYRLSMP